MKKIISFMLISCFISTLFANDLKNGLFVGFDLTGASSKLSNLNNNSSKDIMKFPLGLHIGNKAYITDDFAFITKTYYSFSIINVKFDQKNFELKENNLGINVGLEYDFFKKNNLDVGLSFGFGYEYSILDVLKSDSQFIPNINYGIYTNFSNNHKIGLNFANKNYKEKTITKNSDLYKIKSNNFSTTLSYSYYF